MRHRGCLAGQFTLVIAGGNSAELPELAEAALDGVALAVVPGVEGGRPASAPAAGAAVVLLVFLHRDDGLDAAAAQAGAVGGGGVGLVAHRPARPGAGPPLAPPQDPDLAHQRDEPRAVAVLAWAEDPGDRAAPPVSGQVDLGAQPAPGTAQSLPVRPAGSRVLVIRRCPPGQFRRQGAAGASGSGLVPLPAAPATYAGDH